MCPCISGWMPWRPIHPEGAYHGGRRSAWQWPAVRLGGAAAPEDGGLTMPLGDAAWLAQTLEPTREPDLKLGGRVRPVLEALQAASPTRSRGVRHSVGWDPSPEVVDREMQGVLATDGYRAGARILAQMGFLLETSLYFPQLEELAAFANVVPELTIVLNHIGGLLRVGPYANRDNEVLAQWRRGVATVAQCPNIVMKLGGEGQARDGID